MLQLFQNSYWVVFLAVVIIFILFLIRYFLLTTNRKKTQVLVGNAQIIGKRLEQEDSFSSIATKNGVIALVADGMGGYENGRLASKIVVDIFINEFEKFEKFAGVNNFFVSTLKLANRKVLDAAKGVRMGTTLISVVIKDKKLHYLSVGDSAIILFRNHQLINLNEKHVFQTVLEQKYVSGEISEGQMLNNPMKKRITSYVGAEVLKYVDINEKPIQLRKGDKVILCTDGVTNSLSELELESVMLKKVDPFEMSEMIMAMIKKKNMVRQDNATVIILEVTG
jgi:serine/threonine protein phosphatase PrpC